MGAALRCRAERHLVDHRVDLTGSLSVRKVGIIQPSYLPWRGFFDFIQEVDVFVFLDDVQYTVRDWRSRNRIKTQSGDAVWLSVPVLGGRNQLIRDARIDNAQPWIRKHRQAIERSYGRTAYFGEYFGAVSAVYSVGFESLSDLDVALTKVLCACLGIEKEFVIASSLECDGSKDDKLLAIVQRLGGDVYLSGPSAAAYLRPALWRDAGVELRYKDYSGYPEYPQISPPFEPSVSVLDTLFMLGKAAPDYIWGRHRSTPLQVASC